MIFKEYRIDELFEITTPRTKVNANTVAISKNRRADFYPYVVRTSENNGRRGYIKGDESGLNPAYTFSFGQDTATVFWQTEAYFTGDKIKVLVPKETLSEEAAMYLLCVIRKAFSNFKWGQNSFNERIIAERKLSLPTTPSGSPDWTYMEKYIKEIEKKYIEKEKLKADVTLKSYLDVTCFDDCRLTDEEEKVLLEDKEMGEFALSSIVEKVSLKCLKKDFDKSRDTSKMRTDEFSLPLATAATSGNGTVVYGRKEDFETAKMCIQILQNGDAGNVFIHPEEIGVLQDSYLVRPICENYSENQLLYISTAIQKKIKPLFSWHNKAGWNKIKDLCIVLPITSENAPDYVFMDTYISAIKKKAISETVQYTNNRLKELEKITA